MIACIVSVCTSVAKARAQFAYLHNPGGENLIIFVHGVGGSKNTTFSNSHGMSWMNMIASDHSKTGNGPPLSTYAIGFLTYPASRGDTLTLPQIVRNVANELERRSSDLM